MLSNSGVAVESDCGFTGACPFTFPTEIASALAYGHIHTATPGNQPETIANDRPSDEDFEDVFLRDTKDPRTPFYTRGTLGTVTKFETVKRGCLGSLILGTTRQTVVRGTVPGPHP